MVRAVGGRRDSEGAADFKIGKVVSPIAVIVRREIFAIVYRVRDRCETVGQKSNQWTSIRRWSSFAFVDRLTEISRSKC
jgi:hypothetical protein